MAKTAHAKGVKLATVMRYINRFPHTEIIGVAQPWRTVTFPWGSRLSICVVHDRVNVCWTKDFHHLEQFYYGNFLSGLRAAVWRKKYEWIAFSGQRVQVYVNLNYPATAAGRLTPTVELSIARFREYRPFEAAMYPERDNPWWFKKEVRDLPTLTCAQHYLDNTMPAEAFVDWLQEENPSLRSFLSEGICV